MIDTIDRKKLIEDMKHFCIGNCRECDYSTFLANDEHCGLIDRQPKVGEWIPVSERLPELESLEEFKEYIVMIKDAIYPTTLFYEGDDEWRDMEGNWYIVKAWQPLPEPYKEGDKNE